MEINYHAKQISSGVKVDFTDMKLQFHTRACKTSHMKVLFTGKEIVVFPSCVTKNTSSERWLASLKCG